MERLPFLALPLFSLVFLQEAATGATIIDFEEITAATNINPSNPYVHSGVSISPLNPESAVFPATSGQALDGNAVAFFGFAEGNTITITAAAGGTFSIDSLVIGVSSAASNPTIDYTITGQRAELPDLVSSSNDITSLTVILGWTDLDSLTIDVSDDAGIDNLTFSAVPEPSSALLLGLGTLGLAARRRRG